MSSEYTWALFEGGRKNKEMSIPERSKALGLQILRKLSNSRVVDILIEYILCILGSDSNNPSLAL